MIPRGLYRNMLVEPVPGYEQVSLETLAHYANKGRASPVLGSQSISSARVSRLDNSTVSRQNTSGSDSLAPKRIRKPRQRRERKIGIGLPNDAIERNAKVISGLTGQYSRIGLGVEMILDQAKVVYHARERNDQNNPEIYELFEDGDIDQALDILGAPIWVIGRPGEN